MKTRTLVLVAALMAGTAATAGTIDGESSKNHLINTKTSKVYWTATKVGGSHTGTIDIANGSITIKNNGVESANIVMDMKSIQNTDLEDPGYKAKLEGHLRSDDFFAVEKFVQSTFKVTEFSPIKNAKKGDSNYTLTGDLTIKGITHSVSFPALLVISGDNVTVNGTLTFDRSKWDVRYGSGSFFEGLGDHLIYDDVELRFQLFATTNQVN